jgi:hypothetical protein
LLLRVCLFLGSGGALFGYEVDTDGDALTIREGELDELICQGGEIEEKPICERLCQVIVDIGIVGDQLLIGAG